MLINLWNIQKNIEIQKKLTNIFSSDWQMLSILKLQSSSPLLVNNSDQVAAGNLVSGRRFSIRLRQRQLASLSVQSETASSSEALITSNLNSTIGSSSAPQLSQWTLTHRHIHILNFIACAVHIYFFRSITYKRILDFALLCLFSRVESIIWEDFC